MTEASTVPGEVLLCYQENLQTIQEDLLGSEGEIYSTAEVEAKAFGYKDFFEGDVNICNYTDGEMCPAAGTYAYSIDFSLPAEAKKKWYHRFIKKSYYGKNELKFDFEDIDAKVKCTFKVHADGIKKSKVKKTKSKKSSDDDDDDDDFENITSAAALVLVGAAAVFGINRRRRVATAGLTDEMLQDDRDEATSDFKMMGNKIDGTIMVH